MLLLVCVVPSILFKQLEAMGIRGTALDPFKSYFNSRNKANVLLSFDKNKNSFERIQSNFESILGVRQSNTSGSL